MLIAAAPDPAGGVRTRPLTEAGASCGDVSHHLDLGAVAGERDRLLWPSTAEAYPPLVRAGRRVARCHDVELTEALLLGHAGRWGEPRALPAAWARLVGAPVPADPPPRPAVPPGAGQDALFDPSPPDTGLDVLAALTEVYRDQLRRLEATGHPARFRLLVAAESAGALLAVEMGADGLPWRADVHDRLLVELLGEPSAMGGPPRRLAELAAGIADAFGGYRIHPESPAEVQRALRREGISVPSTRAWVLRGVDHPAIPLLLEYKELHRIWTAHGWSWLQQWVRNGRFHPEYVPAGVVSGRWATRGGGALQIPKVVRRAVVADPGWAFVVADAGQLEPRVLAAVSGDPGMSRAAGGGDMYAALATESFGGDRATAKVALLGAMYGQVGGQAAPALATLRHSYPQAFAYVEEAARVGESGGLVRSWLGRTCPPTAAMPPVEDDGPGAGARARGRFTRNFVIQATAAEWALTLLALLRTELAGTSARLVFFQHDEVVVHTPVDQAAEVAVAVEAAGEQARRLLFGDTPVRFPLDVSIVECYADAK